MGRFDDYTKMGGDRWNFPSTHWSWVYQVRSPEEQQRSSALNRLIDLYWKPVYCWLRRRGYNNEDAKDLTQEFFIAGLEKEKFEKADAARGRFRTFLLKCLSNFVSNYKRDKKAGVKCPSKPIISIDQFDTGEVRIELFHTDTPEDSFNRAWVNELLMRVLKRLQEDCSATAKEQHYQLFFRRIIEPILDGTPQPSIKDLAEEMGLSNKQASNYLITARRAYHRLLRDEIRQYASSDEEVALEIEDLFKFVAGRRLI
jgi:RNA polymerase sigma-70 factor (ECF subfamily)